MLGYLKLHLNILLVSLNILALGNYTYNYCLESQDHFYLLLVVFMLCSFKINYQFKHKIRIISILTIVSAFVQI